ncbi:YdaS family helix-turn-helix protein [Pseudomonas lactis]|uniref:YdaS family helix-turn-helix protein n=1 Tax=Pseudomonas lactis TaxID=1615674 RepID=UPI003F808B34
MTNPISLLIEYFKGQARTAEALGVSQALVSYWLAGSQKISPEKAFLAEQKTFGSVTAAALCPLIAELDARHKVSESSSVSRNSAPGPDGSVCTSSI